MEIKNWTYKEFPAFDEPVEGAAFLETTGNEQSILYLNDVIYATMDGIELTLQILIPTSRNNPYIPEAQQQNFALPCCVFVKGSAWMKQNVYINLCDVAKVAARGYVCAIVQYRHSLQAPFPAQAVDTRNAIRYLRKNAAKYGIDPARMIVAGGSSGGHTAMWAGMRHNDDTEENIYPGISGEVSGIINYYGSVTVMLEASNPSTPNYKLPDSPEGMEMGCVNLREREDLARALSVEENIDENTIIPPVLIFHGTKDRIVNTRQSVVLYEKLKACRKDAALYLLKGADHGGAEFWTKEVIDIADKFITDCFAK